jgi:Domain of unknown function (DUF4386)
MASINFGVIQHLVTPGDPARTARDILASAGLFRLGIAALAAVVILDIVVAWALQRFFEPVHQGQARIAAWLRISYAAIFAVAIRQLPGVLPLLTNARHLTAFSADPGGQIRDLRLQPDQMLSQHRDLRILLGDPRLPLRQQLRSRAFAARNPASLSGTPGVSGTHRTTPRLCSTRK